jgi:outer membrane protein assembly factor BamB
VRPARAVVLAALLVTTACTSATVRRPSVEERAYPAGVAQLRWRIPVHEPGLFEARPEECATGVIVGPELVVGSRGGNVLGVRVADGRVNWSTKVSGAVDSEARFDEGRRQVYVGTDDGMFYAIEPRTGRIRWSYKAKGSIERVPEMDQASVYLTTASDRVVALDAGSGKFRWQYERETPEGFTIHGHSGARLRGNVLYAGFSDGYLVALQSGSGELVWARSLAAASDQFVDVDSTPFVHEGQLFTSSYSGGLYALRAVDGEVQWRLGIEGASAVRVVQGRLYVSAPRDGLAALTAKGHVLWRQGLAAAGDLTAPVAVGPYLIFSASRAGLFIVERTSGKLLQVFNPGRGMCAAPAVDADGRNLYVLSNSGSLYALKLLW